MKHFRDKIECFISSKSLQRMKGHVLLKIYLICRRESLFHNTVPYPLYSVSRDKVTADVPAYITHGHREDHADHLMEYVRNGGGLIIGGHAWHWASQNENACYLLEHPGNKIISRAGIVFSKDRVHDNNYNDLYRIDKAPELKYSLYYAIKACISHPSTSYWEEMKMQHIIKRNTLGDIQRFAEQLQSNDFFHIILQNISTFINLRQQRPRQELEIQNIKAFGLYSSPSELY